MRDPGDVIVYIYLRFGVKNWRLAREGERPRNQVQTRQNNAPLWYTKYVGTRENVTKEIYPPRALIGRVVRSS